MKALIEIRMDNNPFWGAPQAELAWILRELASKVEDGGEKRRIYDSNGNAVGSFRIVEGVL